MLKMDPDAAQGMSLPPPAYAVDAASYIHTYICKSLDSTLQLHSHKHLLPLELLVMLLEGLQGDLRQLLRHPPLRFRTLLCLLPVRRSTELTG